VILEAVKVLLEAVRACRGHASIMEIVRGHDRDL
jgi:hypothetical protein